MFAYSAIGISLRIFSKPTSDDITDTGILNFPVFDELTVLALISDQI